MQKFIKNTTKSLLALCVLVAIGVGVLVNTVNPNDYKTTIAEKLQHATGKTIVLGGNIHWKLFPHLGFTLDSVQVQNPQGFSNNSMASIKQLVLSLKILPLLKGSFEFKQLVLQQPTLHLEVNSQGQANWLVKQLAPVEHKLPSKTNVQATANKNTVPDISIAQFKIDNAAVYFKNSKTHQQITLEKVYINARNVNFGQAFPVSMGLQALQKNQKDNKAIKLTVTYKGQIALDKNAKALSALALNGKLSLKDLNFSGLKVDSLTSNLSLKNSILNLKAIVAKLYEGSGSGQVNVSLKDLTRFETHMQITKVNISPLVKDTTGSDRITGTSDFTVDIASYGLNPEQLLDNIKGSSSFKVSNGTLKGFNIGQQVRWAVAYFKQQKQPVDKNTSTRFGDLHGEFNIKNGIATIKTLKLEGENYNITGQGNINLPAQSLNILLNTKMHKLDNGNSLKEIETALGGSVPIRVLGTFASIKAYPDFTLIGKAIVAKTHKAITGEIHNLVKNKKFDTKKIMNSLFN